ncbi:MAG: rRNA maturation RNase YbeY [Spirochaetales bacterium]|nr:rRNA maturation RNase YbeY [Spirochaetales bacterium]
MNNLLVKSTDRKNRIRKKKLVRFAEHLLDELGTDNWEISLLFCSDTEIAVLNQEYRKKEGPTDVLSFSQDGFLEKKDEQIYYAGDIVVSMDSVRKNSSEYNVPFNEELKRVIIHGILHLHGHTHDSTEMDEPMIQLQEKLLGSFQGDKLV